MVRVRKNKSLNMPTRFFARKRKGCSKDPTHRVIRVDGDRWTTLCGHELRSWRSEFVRKGEEAGAVMCGCCSELEGRVERIVAERERRRAGRSLTR